MDSIQNSLSHRNPEPEKNVLYLVGTPIGNLNDISKRAINILSKVDYIACEDTRVTSKLLKSLEISNRLISFHQHNSKKRSSQIIDSLKKGESIALVSDAGTPVISDPGEFLVKLVRKNNLEAICIPGPCAALTALVSSGLTSTRFTFYGFIPRTEKDRNQIFLSINKNKFASIFYESPKRIKKTLLGLKVICGGKRQIFIGKELTKKYELHIGNNIDEVINFLEKIEPKGEYTVVVGGNDNLQEVNDILIIKEELLDLIRAGLSHSAASIYLSKKYRKTKSSIYKLILDN